MRHFFLILLIFFAFTNSSSSDANNADKEQNLVVGDSREVVKEKWGNPAQIDRPLEAEKPKETWIYTCQYLEPCGGCTNWYYELPCYYLFFENKKLQSWQDVR